MMRKYKRWQVKGTYCLLGLLSLTGCKSASITLPPAPLAPASEAITDWPYPHRNIYICPLPPAPSQPIYLDYNLPGEVNGKEAPSQPLTYFSTPARLSAKMCKLGINIFFEGDDIHLLVPDDLLFESHSANITWRNQPPLELIADFLKQYPQMPLIIQAHTDHVSYPPQQKQLSELQANVVQNYLINEGVRNNFVSVAGYGSTQPIASEHTQPGNAANRRVEIIIKFIPELTEPSFNKEGIPNN